MTTSKRVGATRTPPTDFVFLNVRGLLERYTNPTLEWPEIVRALSRTQLAFFQANDLLRQGFDAPLSIDDLVLRYSDFSDEGQAFVMSQAVERWLSACGRQEDVEAYKDQKGLTSRLTKFRAARAPS